VSGNRTFGQTFGERMLTCEFAAESGWSQPKVRQLSALTIHPGALGLQYGQQVLEGIRAVRGVDDVLRIFRLQDHLRRMSRSAAALQLPALDEVALCNAMVTLVLEQQESVPAGAGSYLYLRPTMLATDASLLLRTPLRCLLYVITTTSEGLYGTELPAPGLRVKVVRGAARAAQGGAGAVKTGGNYGPTLGHELEAARSDAQATLWLDARHGEYIEELGTMNFFMRRDDALITPPLSTTILAGVTRDTVCCLARASEMRLEERPIELTELVEGLRSGAVSEVFGTGTAAGVVSIRELQVDGEWVGIAHPPATSIAGHLRSKLLAIQHGAEPDRWGWTTQVQVGHPRA
jgi:branched-chain amino acid aminotransferase